MTFAVISRSDGAAGGVHQRARGSASIDIILKDGVSLASLCREAGSARIRFPRPATARTCEAILINTAGGMTGGDVFATEVSVGEGAAVSLTTQAAEKVYRSLAGPACVGARLTVARGGRIEWLPQETILFNGSSIERRLDANVAEDGRLLIVEPVVFGRIEMGERLVAADFHDRWRIRRNGRLIHAEASALSGAVGDLLMRPAVLGGGRAMATILYVAPDAERFAEPLALVLGEGGGASAFDGKLVGRVVADDGFALSRRIAAAMAALRAAPIVN
ncbi:MAG: urease accessory protein UreD [Bauldia sp.]